MTDQHFQPTSVLLVGSVPFNLAQDVFTKVSVALPKRLHSIPDGETGIRYNWIRWQLGCFPPETILFRLGGLESADSQITGYTLDAIQPTRFDDVAVASYADFVKLRSQCVISSDVRFQVSLPTPFNPVQCLVRPDFHERLMPLYEARFLEALVRILKELPHSDLVIQFDLTYDIMALEFDRGRLTDPWYKPFFSPIKQGILDRVHRLCAVVPLNVELGIHLCYGDREHKHFIEPLDLGLLVELANDILAILDHVHPVAYIHMPVPKSRTDAAYFEPLKGLKFPQGLLYLGLVHAHDETGTRDRIRTASSVYKSPFGVATECGMGRTPEDDIDSILYISKVVTKPKDPSLA